MLFSIHRVDAQLNSTIHFHLFYDSKQIVGNDSLPLFVNDSLKIEINELKFYVSNIQFLKNKKVVFEEKNSFHLIDLRKPFSQKISINKQTNVVFDEIAFSLGIDSLTNVSGVLGGDLDPTNGMYWAWQSGYINFKLEGKKNNKVFIFHLGGYQNPFYCMQRLSFVINHSNQMNVVLDVKDILEKAETLPKQQIMSPSEEAFVLSKIIGGYFSIMHK